MFCIESLKLNSKLVDVKCPSRSELFKKSTFQGFKYKQEVDDVAPKDYQEFRHMSKDEVFNKGQQLVSQDIADQTLAELQQQILDEGSKSKNSEPVE